MKKWRKLKMMIDYNEKRITIFNGHTIASRYGGEWTIKESETKYPIQLPESDIIEVAANAAIYVSGIAVRSDKRGNAIYFKDSFNGGFKMEIFTNDNTFIIIGENTWNEKKFSHSFQRTSISDINFMISLIDKLIASIDAII